MTKEEFIEVLRAEAIGRNNQDREHMWKGFADAAERDGYDIATIPISFLKESKVALMFVNMAFNILYANKEQEQ